MHTPARQTLLGESAVLVVTVLNMMANDDHGVESSVFPTQCKRFAMIVQGKISLARKKFRFIERSPNLAHNERLSFGR